MYKKLILTLAVLPFFCAFITAQNEYWGGIGTYYDFAASSTTTQNKISHGIGLQGRFFSFKKDVKAGMYVSLSIDYSIHSTRTALNGAKPSEESFPVKFGLLFAPVFKFPIAGTVVFYVAPGVHAAIMPEFAFGLGVDTGFIFFINSSFFLGVGATGAFHFVGVDFFKGGNLSQYISGIVQPSLSVGWRNLY